MGMINTEFRRILMWGRRSMEGRSGASNRIDQIFYFLNLSSTWVVLVLFFMLFVCFKDFIGRQTNSKLTKT